LADQLSAAIAAVCGTLPAVYVLLITVADSVFWTCRRRSRFKDVGKIHRRQQQDGCWRRGCWSSAPETNWSGLLLMPLEGKPVF